MLRSLLNVYSISLLLSTSCLANPGDKVIIQLLVDDNEMKGVHQKVNKALWDDSNKIAFPHVSFIEVEDTHNIIKENYKEFLDNVSSLLKRQSIISKLQFTGQGVNPYNSQHTGVTYWCLEDVDKSSSSPFNSALKSVGEETKKSIKDFILTSALDKS